MSTPSPSKITSDITLDITTNVPTNTVTNNEVGKVYVRPWGNYQTIALGRNYQVKIITVNPGGRLSLQKHAQRAERWVVVQGRPTITIESSVKEYGINDAVFIPIGALHRLENFAAQELVVVVEVQMGEYLGEDDIVRVEDIYNRNEEID